jgi:AcrR family transcriptional regulator
VVVSQRSLDRASIVRTAIALADREGLAAVSIRRVAAVLDARPMTLYSHVPSKGDLLDLMFDELAREALLGEDLPAGWRTALTAIASRTRDLGLAHPWSLELLGQRAQVGPNTLAVLDEWLRAVRDLALAPETAWTVVTAVNDYVVGYTARAAAQRRAVPVDRAEARRWHRAVASYLGGLADSGSYPDLAPLLRKGFAAESDSFDTGLTLLLDSVERAHGSRRKPRGPGRAGSVARGGPRV